MRNCLTKWMWRCADLIDASDSLFDRWDDEAVDRRVKVLAEQVEKRCLKIFLYLPIKAGKTFGWDDDQCQAMAFRMAEIYNEELRCPTQAEIDFFAEEVTRITGIGWE